MPARIAKTRVEIWGTNTDRVLIQSNSVISRGALDSKATGWAQSGRAQAHESFGLRPGRQLGLDSRLSPGFRGRIDRILINCVPTKYPE